MGRIASGRMEKKIFSLWIGPIVPFSPEGFHVKVQAYDILWLRQNKPLPGRGSCRSPPNFVNEPVPVPEKNELEFKDSKI